MNKTLVGEAAAVARTAAELTLNAIEVAVHSRGRATWILAGGTSPTLAYRDMLERDLSGIDWGRVTVAIGDERFVPLSDPDSNWAQIAPVLLATAPLSAMNQLVPNMTTASVDDAARDYAERLAATSEEGAPPRLDIVWLGVGEDGHTLSLFPGQPGPALSHALVSAVYDSPKPPPNRITLTLGALANVGLAVVFATGAGKKDALARAEADDLPIAVASRFIESHGGRVEWLFDDAAWTP